MRNRPRRRVFRSSLAELQMEKDSMADNAVCCKPFSVQNCVFLPVAAPGRDAAACHAWMAGVDRRVSEDNRTVDQPDRARRRGYRRRGCTMRKQATELGVEGG